MSDQPDMNIIIAENEKMLTTAATSAITTIKTLAAELANATRRAESAEAKLATIAELAWQGGITSDPDPRADGLRFLDIYHIAKGET